jgi:polyribonucleotide nucleotidyltransferase
MGLISKEGTDKYAVLSDILGDEDHLGDMDFKVVGTNDGITACQMDIKINGLKWDMVYQALQQARDGRLHILGEMNKAISTPRTELKPHAPRVEVIEIEKEYIGAVIGPGGKVVQDIQAKSGAKVAIEERDGKGFIEVFSSNADAMNIATGMIKAIVAVPEVGETYHGTVKNIMDFGAFVEFMPGKDGLLHISEITWERLNTMEGVFKEGDKIDVKLIEVDKKTGKFRLSRKALLPKPEGYVEPAPRERREGGDRGPRRENRDDRGPRRDS